MGKDGVVPTSGHGLGISHGSNRTTGEGTSVGNIRSGQDKVKNSMENKTSVNKAPNSVKNK